MKVAFLVNDLQLSGGSRRDRAARPPAQRDRRLGRHARARARAGGSRAGTATSTCRTCTCARASRRSAEHYDVAVATWWETTFTLFELSAERHAYFVQSLEDRFYRHDEAERLGAALTLDLPVAFITEAHWIRDTLAGLRPDAPCYLVRNGIDKDVFAPLEQRADQRRRARCAC